MTNKEKNQRILSSIGKMMAIIVTTYILTYAWFSQFVSAGMSALRSETNKINEISISLDNGATWKSIADLTLSANFTFGQLVTSNGIDFYKADLKEDDGTPLRFIPAVANEDYLEYRVLFKSKIPTAILFNNTSYVKPNVGNTELLLFGADVERKSIYGDFSKDIIAGAVRVGVVENTVVGEVHTPQTTAKMVWAPNKEYEMINTNGDITASITSTSSQNYNYLAVTNPTTFAEARVLNLKDNLNASFDDKTAGGDFQLTYINSTDVFKSITIRIWVEGNDREAITALKGGQFKTKLSFVGISKQNDTVAPSVTANTTTHTITGYTSVMEHSIDYGNNWITYATNPTPTIAVGATVYVRKSETTLRYASTYTTLNF